MKNRKIITVFGLLAAMSFGASAAQLVNDQQASGLQSVGTVSLGGVAGAPADIRQQLSQKADAQGAAAYRIVEARNNDTWHVTAELYK
ncbi:hypothetical protein BTJ39_14985 [Izhakiella australiensis]|uniref:YdgH/BhsA/McbA-like domain-containing protein n=1 Tax=Izhakiella australiensis TaxID=1926881 RepID=A0A1S8YJJ2_9GAMM|nr:peroxide/acid stress response protein YhcN [Izhakiella australiensis]OON39234.1 hypothetical protein BTJ39_14985 [Izhakiella australiensis]